jgi:hypothetical protein
MPGISTIEEAAPKIMIEPSNVAVQEGRRWFGVIPNASAHTSREERVSETIGRPTGSEDNSIAFVHKYIATG